MVIFIWNGILDHIWRHSCHGVVFALDIPQFVLLFLCSFACELEKKNCGRSRRPTTACRQRFPRFPRFLPVMEESYRLFLFTLIFVKVPTAKTLIVASMDRCPQFEASALPNYCFLYCRTSTRASNPSHHLNRTLHQSTHKNYSIYRTETAPSPFDFLSFFDCMNLDKRSLLWRLHAMKTLGQRAWSEKKETVVLCEDSIVIECWLGGRGVEG